nr:FAD:protein FMN transferase [uncultured Desulfuromonas sp.]
MLRRFLILAGLVIIAAVVYLNHGSKREIGPLSLSGATMGTTYHLKIILPPAAKIAPEMISAQVTSTLSKIDHLMSTYKEDSEVSRFNQLETNQWFPLSQPTFHVINAAQHYSSLSDGAFDITVGKLVNLWGFGPTINVNAIPDSKTIDQLRNEIGYKKLQLRQEPMAILKESEAIYIDLSAIAKGYAVDAVASVLEQNSLHNYMVEIGGEIRTSGSKQNGQPWSIGIESPVTDQRSVQKVLHLRQSAMATSGDYRNYFEHDGQRFSHTIDPRTGYPIKHKLASVTVISQTCMDADALATLLTVLGPKSGMEFAEKHGLSIFMIIKTQTGFEERSSSAFIPYLKQ